MRLKITLLLVLVSSLTGPAVHAAGSAAATAPPNVLFIAIDDLNHWVGHLGRNRQTITPNLDRLAKMGVTFTNAHCAAPVCNPSRAALLSGKRPGTTGVYDNNQPFANAVKPEESLVMQFKKAGFDTLGIGKLWHGGLGWKEQWTTIADETKSPGAVESRNIGGIAFGPVEGGDDTVSDTSIADYGIRELGKMHDRPFFLTLGFHKPHMPWNVPRKYFDMHPLAEIVLPPTMAGDLDDVPAMGKKMARPGTDHAAVVASGRWKEAVQAYLATITYLDGQIGRVLDAYESSPARERTLICLWGDHGWHLGEKEHWRKFALWEEATRTPYIWVVPGVTKPGGVCAQPVDLMSVYPTLCDLAGIPKPAWVEGDNIRPLLTGPTTEWDGAGITTFHLNNHAIRTARWRYIRYADGGEELYDHSNDEYEWTNLAGKPELTSLKASLLARLPKANAPEMPARGAAGENGGNPAVSDEIKANRKAKRQAQKTGTP